MDLVKGAAEYPQKTFRNAYTLVIMFISFAVLAIGGYSYTHHVQRQADHQWCALLIAVAQPPPSDPLPTQRQERTYQLLKDLARDKGCT